MSRQSASAEPRAWQRMLSGRRLDLLDPSPLDVEIADIAHGLARVARWNGQTSGDHAFSVAQHCLVVERIFALDEADPRWRLAALLHDAPEYVIGDMISPFKAVLGGNYKGVETRLQAAIHLRFSLPAALPASVAKAIKAADRISARYEAVLLAGFQNAEATRFFGRCAVDLAPSLFEPQPARASEDALLERFSELEAAIAALTPLSGSQTRHRRHRNAMTYLVVSSLADLPTTVAEHGALDVVTLINAQTPVERPGTIAADRHLLLTMNDIAAPAEGLIHPNGDHLEQLIEFGHRWDRSTPLAIHCWAGISRSTAAAYILALAINPDLDEVELAEELRRRAPTATPNPLLVAMADEKLGRGGRMIEAIHSIGRGADAFAGTPFVLPLTL